MDKIYYKRILYRILEGRLRLPFCDPVLYIHEPDSLLVGESFDVYQETYDNAYFDGIPIKEELKEILFYNDMWSPDDDKKAKEAEDNIEDLKVEAYQKYYDASKLNSIKRNIRMAESTFKKYKSKLHALDHISCEGVSELARSVWLVSKTIKDRDKKDVNPENLPLTKILEYYNSKAIDGSDLRYIARNEPFRVMWQVGKKESNVFGRPSIELTRDQLSLCQFSSMYDNVYESTESPDEDVVNDDDCLDGWFIVPSRERESNKNKREMEKLLSNKKVANSDEIFLMAQDTHTAKKISDLNSPVGKAIIANRNEQIKHTGSLSFTEFSDIRQDVMTQASQQAIQKIKGK
jgi:hypothetical protein